MHMNTCDECADLLLDFLYGLLEAEEVQGLRDHLADCAACRTALAQAEAQQGLLARAARVVREVPAFVAPSESGIKELSASRPTEETPPAPAAVNPLTLPLVASRPRASRRWPWLATAAALLLLAGGLTWSYEHGLERRTADLARAEGQVKAVEGRFASAAQTYEQDLARLPSQVPARQLRVQLTGPAAYQPDAPGQVRVVTQNAHGAPAAAHLQVGVLDPAGKRMVYLQDFESPGELAVVLPAGLQLKPGEGSQLVVKAATRRGGEAELREVLATGGPSYETHVVLNKPTYRAGEVVFFRTLTLNRFSMKPPGSEIPLTFTLRDARHVAIKQLQGKTRPDGIGGGEFALDALPGGASYSLEVTPAAPGKSERVQPRACHFTIVRDEATALAGLGGRQVPTNQVFFERNNYAPGDKVRGEFRSVAQLQNGTAANQSVQVNARQANGQAIPIEGAPAGKPLRTVTDARGRATFGLQLPPDIGQGRPLVEVEVLDGKANARYQQDIPVTPPNPAVEFFPEGGDLTAGVPNRVYFRAETAPGTPAALEGRVVDRQGKEVARLERERDGGAASARGLGAFTFTPEAAETYTFQVAVAPQTQKVLPLPPVHRAGITLHVPAAVGREGEPIRVIVRSSAPQRRLLVLATCRGHVVDQQFVRASPEGTEVRLSPVSGSRGIVRLTIYEVRQDQLLPRAERLVYQIPTERLVLSCADAAGGAARTYRPGEHLNLGIKAVDEKGEPAPATLLAAVVDERVLPPGQQDGQGPPAFYYLAADVRGGEDLENADFLVSDTPEARAALDLFLGTQGWRRFSESELAPLLAKAAELDGMAAVAERPAVFSRDNFNEVNAGYDKALALAREELRRQAVQERVSLQDERDRRLDAARVALASLGDYQELPRRVLGMAAGVLVLVLFVAGGALLVVGFVRTVRGSRPTMAFVGAFASLLLCLGIYGATGELRQPDHGDQDAGRQARLVERRLPPLPEMAPAADPKLGARPQDRSAPIGRFAETQQLKRALSPLEGVSQERVAGAGGKDMMGREESLRRAAVAEQLAKARQVETKKSGLMPAVKGAMTRGSQEKGPPGNEPPPPASTLVPAPAASPAGAAPPSPAGKMAPDAARGPPANSLNELVEKPQALTAKAADKKDDLSALTLRQYAYRENGRPGGPSPDTVLWYPALVAADGTARIGFDLSGQPATYRVLLYAHSPSGRLGAYRGQIETRK